VDVGDVAEGVEGGLEAGGVEGVARGYVAGGKLVGKERRMRGEERT
jgi:hypothetical protein